MPRSPESGAPPTARVRVPPAQPLYLEGKGAPVFAFLHRGANPPRQTAVLLCPPFGWEDMCSYRIRREWAEHLARAGHTTLRIDLPGSGDSAGAPHDPRRLDAWTEAVEEAARWLRRPLGLTAAGAGGDGNDDGSGDDGSGRSEMAGAMRVAVVCIGLGGMVSCRAALRGARIDELVLWSVPARGRTLLRELRTISAFEVANKVDDGELAPSDESVDDGTLVINGYLLSAETVAELERLDLREELESSTRATRTSTRATRLSSMRRALLLGRDGLKVDKALPAVLERAGATVTIADGPGYGAMMVEPQDARTPIEVFELVSSWLEDGESLRGAPVESRVAMSSVREHGAPYSAATNVAGPNDAAAIDVAATDAPGMSEPQSSGEAVLDHAGVALRERPVFFDGPSGRMFGVLTEPLGARKELTALLLNAGPQRRTGPNRMWVEIARRWAANGVPTLRLDADGIGDSDGDATVLGRVAAFYRPGYVEQARVALEMLAQRGLPPRFVTLGLCAGAYWSVRAALADERVVSVVMLNPRTLVFDEWRHTVRRTRVLRERALMASTWRKVLRGEIKLSQHLETGRTLAQQAASTLMSAPERIVAPRQGNGLAREPAAREPLEDLFSALRDRDQRALLLFTGKEVLHTELSRKGVLDRLDRWPNLELVLTGTSADTHTLTPLWLQRQVHERVDRVLAEELGRLPGS
jgi:pimeloyl-ACP methyl ester carboxylesterase